MVGKYVCTARHRHGDHKLLLVEGPRSTVQYKQLADKVEKWGLETGGYCKPTGDSGPDR